MSASSNTRWLLTGGLSRCWCCLIQLWKLNARSRPVAMAHPSPLDRTAHLAVFPRVLHPANDGATESALKHHPHRRREIAEAVALLADVADAGPREVVGDERG